MLTSGLKIRTRRPASLRAAPPESGSARSPRPRITTGPPCKNNAQSDPIPPASSASCARPSGRPAASFNARKTIAALLLPPPSPAPVGIRLCRENCAPLPHPLALRNASAARKTKFVASTGTAASAHVSSNGAPSPINSIRISSPNDTGATTDSKS
ncbi:hypothetical protein M2103_000398 [Ereboglobus sp. PH5-5]|nr:hypothetical protein [Ereboglobus sp. PH5-5]